MLSIMEGGFSILFVIFDLYLIQEDKFYGRDYGKKSKTQ